MASPYLPCRSRMTLTRLLATSYHSCGVATWVPEAIRSRRTSSTSLRASE
jgi:hypothetical protein